MEKEGGILKHYLSALEHIFKEGKDRKDRTGIGTRGIFGHQLRFDLRNSFPAVTTKKLAWRSVVSELLWFLEGETDERRLAEIHYGQPREELKEKDPQSAIKDGFSRAFVTIFDANVTTLIAALILYVIGTGPVKGFAVTLSIGIVTSMFTAIMCTRAMVNLIYGNKNITAAAIAFKIPFAVFLFLNKKRNLYKFLLLGLIFSSFYVIFLLTARAVFVSIFVCMFFLLLVRILISRLGISSGYVEGGLRYY